MSGLFKRLLAFKGVSHSLIDQAILSISNFLIGLVFIRFATKQEYFAYSQLIGFIALSGALQAALVNTTALTLLPRKQGDDRIRSGNVFYGLQLSLSVVCALAGGFALWLFPSAISSDSAGPLLIVAIVLMVISTWFREFLRNFQFINLRPDMCLQQDIAYVSLLLLAIACLIGFHEVRADVMLLAIGGAGLLTAIPWSKRSGLQSNFNWSDWRKLWIEVWPLAKWALPAGIVAWAFGNGYLFIGGKVIGPEATAEVVAAKLFAAPLGMIFLSWGNIFRPKVSDALSKGERADVQRLTKLSMSGVFMIVAGYCLILILAYPHLEAYVLGEKYRGLSGDIVAWGCFFLASGISSVCNGVLLAGGRFRHSFYAAAVSSVVSVTMVYLLGSYFGKTGLMVGVVAGEATYAGVLYWGMRGLLNTVAHRQPNGGV